MFVVKHQLIRPFWPLLKLYIYFSAHQLLKWILSREDLFCINNFNHIVLTFITVPCVHLQKLILKSRQSQLYACQLQCFLDGLLFNNLCVSTVKIRTFNYGTLQFFMVPTSGKCITKYEVQVLLAVNLSQRNLFAADDTALSQFFRA